MGGIQTVKSTLPVVSINAQPFWHIRNYTIQAQQRVYPIEELRESAISGLYKSYPCYKIHLKKLIPIQDSVLSITNIFSIDDFSLQIAGKNQTYQFSNCAWESITESCEAAKEHMQVITITALTMAFA